MLGQHVEDGPGRRIVEQVVGGVVDQAVRRSRDEKAAVGEGGTQARAEPMIGQRERPGQPIVERQVRFAPVAHADGRRVGRGIHVVACGPGPGLRLHVLDAGHEAVAPSLAPLEVARVPALRGHAATLHGGGTVKGADGPSVGRAVEDLGLAIRTGREALTPALQHAEVIVVGMVLHHQHDDVPDLRQEVGAWRPVGPGERSRRRGRAVARQAFNLMPFEQMPHVPATLESDTPDLLPCRDARKPLVSPKQAGVVGNRTGASRHPPWR